MAPPTGTLRVGRYFMALAAILVLLYSIVAFGSRHTPKLGLDLVGGVRVIFTAQTPKGSPPPTSSQMTQARQILEDRINTTGVTGATVVVQGSDQLVVEIPNGTQTDVARLGKAAILNFRGVVAPAVPVSCVSASAAKKSAGSTTPSPSPSPTGTGGASAGSGSSSGSAGTGSATGSATSSHSPGSAGFHALPLQAKASSTKTATPLTTTKSSTATSTATGTSTSTSSASPSASPSPTTSTPAATSRPICNADPFNTPIKLSGAGTAPFGGKSLFQYDPSLKAKMPTSETCPAPGLATADCKPYTALSTTQQGEIESALSALDCGGIQTEQDLPTSYYYACDDGKTYGAKIAYLLGFVVVPGRLIDSASAQAPSGQNGQVEWTVALTLTSSGADRWSAWTSKYNTTSNATVLAGQSGVCSASSAVPCSDFVAFTLDGQVISAPITQAALSENTQISGNFTPDTARSLAQELNYGKLPVSFRLENNLHVSATLGSAQLKAAFLAGGIGLLLVVIYSLIYYRGLGLVTIASLMVSAGLTYAMLVILGVQLGFTLDLAGIAGFIVALGITADSFVVFFERLKDEVHEGRSSRVAVPRAWVRARRTILSADTVSFLAAAILYYFASADVKGFAFTLGHVDDPRHRRRVPVHAPDRRRCSRAAARSARPASPAWTRCAAHPHPMRTCSRHVAHAVAAPGPSRPRLLSTRARRRSCSTRTTIPRSATTNRLRRTPTPKTLRSRPMSTSSPPTRSTTRRTRMTNPAGASHPNPARRPSVPPRVAPGCVTRRTATDD